MFALTPTPVDGYPAALPVANGAPLRVPNPERPKSRFNFTFAALNSSPFEYLIPGRNEIVHSFASADMANFDARCGMNLPFAARSTRLS